MCERRAKARGAGHSRPGSWDGSWDELQILGGRCGPERPSKGPGRTLGMPQRTQAPGLRRRERRFESCRGHQTCFFRTHGDKITVGMFKIIPKRPDQHVPRTVPVPAQNAPGAVAEIESCFRVPE